MDYLQQYKFWCESDLFDDATKSELINIAGDDAEIYDRFYKQLSFGTGGLRGVLGAGTNRMNVYTVSKATQGLANYINEKVENGSVVIAYDSRNMSTEFALRSALTLCANGIKVYLFTSLRPTPELSFAVRELNCTAGIVITASHNPPEYNGYKVYWSDGGQIVPPHDEGIIKRVNSVNNYADIKFIDENTAKESGLLVYVDEEIDAKYIKAVKDNVLNPELIKKYAKDIKIVYTPLHGTGYMPVCRALKELGFENVSVVESQRLPNGNFPTVSYPNPEDKKAFTLALELAKEVDADVALATDPDADRLGIYVKDARMGEYVAFNGNMSGLLIAEYYVSQMIEKGLMPKDRKDGAIVTTIVSSNMADALAEHYGLTTIKTLTGFKYIGEQIKLFEEAINGNKGEYCAEKYAFKYLFGYEESYGCLVGTHARDKDAVMAVVALAEVVAYCKSKNQTLVDMMGAMYEKYGYYLEDMSSITLKGESGAKQISAMISELRTSPIKQVSGVKVEYITDFTTAEKTCVLTGKKTSWNLPYSNVLYYELEGDGWCCVRPSGTEPKIKLYFGVKGVSSQDAEEKMKKLKDGFYNLVTSGAN